MAFEAPEFAAIAANPIKPEKPAGESVTYDPDFEALKGEVGKLEKGEQPNWGEVVSKGMALLQTRTKDLTVASYLAVGLFHAKGYPGLASGLVLLEGLTQGFWDTLYPERPRGRVAAISWLNERSGFALQRKSATSSDHESVEAAVEIVGRLIPFLDEKLAGDSPGLGELRRGLDEASRASAPAPVASAATSSASSSSGGAGLPGANLDSWDGALKGIENIATETRRIVDYMRGYNAGSPIPYLLARGVAWSRLVDSPQERENGETFLIGPPPEIMAAWEASAAGSQWKPLLDGTESRLLGDPFCLDINYYVARALDGLGFPAAAKAVTEQTVALVRRMPKLLELKYSDARPLASDATRIWLEAAGSSGSGGGNAGAAAPEGASAAEEALLTATNEARGLAARGKLNDAVKLLDDGMLQCGIPRERFRWRLALAGICLDAGQAAAAVAHLEALDEDVERHSLEAWEPALATELLKVFYRCEKKLSQSGHRDQKEAVQRLDRLYGRLCRIDTVSALALEGRK